MKSKKLIKEKPDIKVFTRRALRVLLPLLIIIGVIIGSTYVNIDSVQPDAEYYYEKAEVTDILEDHSADAPFTGIQKVTAVITTGKYKGQECELVNSNSYMRGAYCKEGTKILALIYMNDDGSINGSVHNYDRTSMVYILLGLFALILILVGGKKGMAALYALILTFICIIFMYIPLMYVGVNGILAAVLTSLVVLVASIYIINGWSVKMGCAVVGTTIGVLISGLLSYVVGTLFNLSGFNMPDGEEMTTVVATHSGLGVGEILFAGIIISSLGAVMDVSVSVVAAMKEINDKAPSIQAKELFKSGMTVGHDMMGTMSNTLILAYVGSATTTIMMIYAYEMSYYQIMGQNTIIVEILSGLCGTIGVILTVPVQAAITTFILKSGSFHKKKRA